MNTGTANFLSGGLSSFAFWTMGIPADNIKKYGHSHNYQLLFTATDMTFPSRMMATPPTSAAPTFAGTVRTIYAAAGVRGFFAGLSPSLLRAFPSNACAFYVYEGLLRLMNAEKAFGTDVLSQTRH
ncbi:hypothetical protein EIP86_007574 [Pleurotus ostreatoroseus]|nr:hypothetical protein EIP86_007574 [Pleurotus ostreatoroseus]